MKIKEMYSEFDYGIDIGKYFYIVELSEFGIEKDSDKIFELCSQNKNILFKGDLFSDGKELNLLINKLYKNDPSINVYIELDPVRLLKIKQNVTYNIKIRKDYIYNFDIIETYSKKNSRFIVPLDFIIDFLGMHFVPKEKVYILIEELNYNILNFCYSKTYNFLYNFEMIKEIKNKPEG